MKQPPPTFAVFNETKGHIAFWSHDEKLAKRELKGCQKFMPQFSYRMAVLVESVMPVLGTDKT